jgi:hypothetical protein
MAIQIQVKLDTTANPPVTLIPNQTAVNRGNNTIEWTPYANQSFTFADLAGLPNPPFSNVTVNANMMSAQDDNTVAGDFVYSVMVNYNGQLYSSNPTEVARHSNSGVGAKAALGGSNSPTIKNN